MPSLTPASDQEDNRLPSSLTRTLSGTSTASEVTEEELLRQGHTRSQAGRNLVEQNVNEMARQRLLRTLGFALCFFFLLVVVPLALGIAGVVIWASITLNQDKDLPCDMPIREYLWGVMALLVWSSWLQNLFIEVYRPPAPPTNPNPPTP